MLKTILGTAVCAAALSACATQGFDGAGAQARDDTPPPQCEVKVFVRGGNVVVNNEPVHPKGCGNAGSTNTVTWTVKTPGYSFDPAAGIAFGKNGSSPSVSCTKGASQYACSFGSTPTGTFYYSIKLVGPNGAGAGVDPSVIVD